MSTRPASVVALCGEFVDLECSAPCSDCGGCGGRCQLFIVKDGQALRVSRAGLELIPGEQVQLVLADTALSRQAWLGYGLPLFGLLVGAAALQPLGNAAAGVGALLGTSLALGLSKRARRDLPRIEKARTALDSGVGRPYA